jgi:hypothetical protein
MNPHERFLCVQEVSLSVDRPADVQVESFVDNNVRTNGFDKFSFHHVAADDDLIYSEVVTNCQNSIVTASSMFLQLAGGTESYRY